jgi:glycosyltransferase involved in cell wall biosynthesis
MSEPRQRVAILTTSYPRREGDAAGHFVETEARALAARGHDVTVIAPGRGLGISQPHVEWLPDSGLFGFPGALLRLRESPKRALGAVRFVIGARRSLRDKGPFDRVVAHWLVPSAWPVALASSAPLEVVAHGSDVALLLRLPRGVRTAIIKALMRRGAHFRFVSAELRDRLARATLPELIDVSRVEPCAIDVSAAPTRLRARRRLGVARDERLIVIASRLIRDKRVDVALRAAELLPAATLVVVGDGPERSALQAEFPGVRFTGARPRPDALAWIAAADVVLSASRSEGAPTVVREARALGVPVVAAPSGDLLAWAESDPGLAVIAKH